MGGVFVGLTAGCHCRRRVEANSRAAQSGTALARYV